MGVGFVVWVAVFTVGKDLVAMNVQKNLADGHVLVSESKDKSGYEIQIQLSEAKDFTAFWRQFDLLQWRKPILSLEITSNYHLTSMPALDKLQQLKSLGITYNPKLQSLPALNLPLLQSLNIIQNELQSLPALNLPQLRSLNILSNNKLKNLPALNFPQLQKLEIVGNSNLESLPTLDKVPLLQSLNIINNDNLQRLPVLNLPQLQSLEINSNNNLQSLPALNLPRLEKLTLSGNETLQKQLPQVVNGLFHLSILIPKSIFIDNKSIPLKLSPFVLLPNLRLECVQQYDEDQWFETERFVKQRQAANMPAVEIRKVENHNECKL